MNNILTNIDKMHFIKIIMGNKITTLCKTLRYNDNNVVSKMGKNNWKEIWSLIQYICLLDSDF